MFEKKIIKCPYIKECDINVSKNHFENCCLSITRINGFPFKFCPQYVQLKLIKENKIPKKWLDIKNGN